MKTMGLFEAKNRLSEVCEKVASTAEPVVVTRHGKPLVRIVPYPTGAARESVWDTVAEGREKYGRLTEELELPARDASRNRPDPLD